MREKEGGGDENEVEMAVCAFENIRKDEWSDPNSCE
jgi:hypothetical protein